MLFAEIQRLQNMYSFFMTHRVEYSDQYGPDTFIAIAGHEVVGFGKDAASLENRLRQDRKYFYAIIAKPSSPGKLFGHIAPYF